MTPLAERLLVEYGLPRATPKLVERIARDAVYIAARQAWEVTTIPPFG